MFHLVILLVQVLEHFPDALYGDVRRLSVANPAHAVQLFGENNQFIEMGTQALPFGIVQLRKQRLQQTGKVIPVIVQIFEILPGKGIAKQGALFLENQHDAVG
jgi:hypothetical protein